MKRFSSRTAMALFCGLCIGSCQNHDSTENILLPPVHFEKGSYGFDRRFMQDNGKLIVELHNRQGNARLLLSPEFQGRVLTSTAGGDSGASYGWINYDLIASHKYKAHFNAFGGEERLWLGPEGGQFSLYFAKGDSFNIGHWQVPPIIDSLPFVLDSSDDHHAVFSSHGHLVNYSGHSFDIDIARTVSLLDSAVLSKRLAISIPAGIQSVGFESANQIRNAGKNNWKKESGLISIWLLGMMTPSPHTVVFIPFKPGKNSRDLITDNYFGKIGPDRLQIRDSLLFFLCDGKSRGKIGLSPLIAGHLAASFNFDNNTLTLVGFTVDPEDLYVNSKWEIQQFPFRGDAVNSYNDGPLADGSQLGPFYEIESSSPVRELGSGDSLVYRQVTCHFSGDYASLKIMVKNNFGFDLEELRKFHPETATK